MPELRKDPIVGRWVIIAHERAKRPHDFKGEAQTQVEPGLCPFCEGHEEMTPPEIIAYREPGTGALEFFNYRGRCIYCDMVQEELANERRIVLDTTHFTVFCPYASRFPFETWILPKAHSSHFENIPKPGVDDLGTVLRLVLNKL